MSLQQPNSPSLPLAQGDSSQFDQVPHARGNNDGLFVRVSGLIVALHLLHNKLGMAQESVLSEAIEVQPSRWDRGL